jgi:hypothetical protein
MHPTKFAIIARLVAKISSLPLIAIGALLLVSMNASIASAQSGEDRPNDFSIFLGYMLPNQIEGVTEILPVAGGRYSLNYGFGGFEFEGANSKGSGVDFTTLSVRYRADIPVAEGVSALGYGGMDLHWFLPNGATSRQTETGLHGGVAGLLFVTDALWLRADLKLTANPGTALHLLFGVMFRPGLSGQ